MVSMTLPFLILLFLLFLLLPGLKRDRFHPLGRDVQVNLVVHVLPGTILVFSDFFNFGRQLSQKCKRFMFTGSQRAKFYLLV